MREYNVNIPLIGLKTEPHQHDGHIELRNLRPDAHHLTVPGFPAPEWNEQTRLVKTPHHTFLFQFIDDQSSATNWFSIVNESNLTLTQMGTYTFGGELFQVADFKDLWIITNGLSSRAYWEDTVFIIPSLTSVCVRQGRLFCSRRIDGVPENVVRWTMAGGEDLVYMLTQTAVPATLAQNNEAGTAPMPWPGEVRCIKLLGDHVAVYGANGISVLRQTEHGFMFAPIIGLPVGLGIWGRAAVAGGDDDQHVFRGTDGNLWVLTPDLQIQKLGYGWALGTKHICSFDPLRREYWISDKEEAYVLTEHGLGGPIQRAVTSVIHINGEPVVTGTEYPEDMEYLLHTDTFDMRQNAQKRVTLVNLNGQFGQAHVGMRMRYDTDSDWRERPDVRCSPDGAAHVLTNFTYGQLRIRAACAPADRLTRIETRYQAHDRRFVRGTRAIGTTERADDEDQT